LSLDLATSANSATSTSASSAVAVRGGNALKGVDVPLTIYFAGWFLLNYLYNISNKLALKAAGGKDGFPMTISR